MARPRRRRGREQPEPGALFRRRALDAAGADGAATLAMLDSVVVLRAQVDVDAFEAAAARARADRDPAAIERALGVHGGELLPEDRYEPWADARRAALTELHTALCLELAELHGDAPAAGGRSAARAGRRPARGAGPPRADAPVRAHRPSPAGTGPVPAVAPGPQRRAGGRAGPRDSRALPAAAGADAGRDGGGRRQPPAPADLVRRPSSASARTSRALLGRARLRDAHRPRRLRQDAAGARGRRGRAGAAARRRLVRRPGARSATPRSWRRRSPLARRRAESPRRARPWRRSWRTWRRARRCWCSTTASTWSTPCAALAEALLRAVPGVRILATSREPLRCAGEVAWRVPLAGRAPTQPSCSSSAARPRRGRASHARATAQRRRRAEICRALDGMPLAIELAAARVRALALEQIAARLDDSLSCSAPAAARR